MLKSTYDTNNNGIVDNAEKVNNHTVETDVPSDAVFTDTTYTAGTGISISSNVISNTLDISGKVDKVTGKGLSTNDFTDTYKNNVDSNTSARHSHSNKSVLDDIDSTDITNWDSKYIKPTGGIPKTDLSNEVQTSLGKADTSIQSHQDISGKEDKTNKVTSISSSSTNTQYPSAKCVYDSQAIQDAQITELQGLIPEIITGTGENITLNNTAEMKFVKSPIPMANTTQDGTPSPTNEEEVETVTGDVEVKVQNKNLLKVNDISETTLNGLTYKIQNGEMILNGTTTSVTIITNLGIFNQIANENYSWTFIYESGSCTDYGAGLYFDTVEGGTTNNGGGAGLRASQSRTATINNTSTTRNLYLYFRANSGAVFTNYKVKLQIVKGTTSDYNFIEHQQQTCPLTLGNIELCKIGDYQDYIYKENNKWYLHKIIKKIILDGVNYYINSKSSSNTNDFSVAPILSDSVNINSNNTVANVLSSHFTKKSANNIYLNDGTGIAIMTSKALAIEFTLASEISTKELANEWITNNNVTVYYQLATATETEITDTTLISQLEAIEQATSYEGQTNISGTSDGANPIFSVEAYKEREPDYWTNYTDEQARRIESIINIVNNKMQGTVLYSNSEGTKNDTINFTGGTLNEGDFVEITFGRYRTTSDTMVIKTTGKVRYSSGMFVSLDMLYNSGEAVESCVKRVIITSTGLTTDYKHNDNLAIKEIRKFSY